MDVLRRPILPIRPRSDRVLLNAPRADLALAAGDETDALQQIDEQKFTDFGDGLTVRRRKDEFTDAGQAAELLRAVQTVQISTGLLGQLALELRVVQKHGLFDERDDRSNLVT